MLGLEFVYMVWWFTFDKTMFYTGLKQTKIQLTQKLIAYIHRTKLQWSILRRVRYEVWNTWTKLTILHSF